ncbi:hypothetical protein UFOVP432_9 [uncultured Caudovirales phage]|uniref:Uncharacterized protein n=1 Tax=uncultured Caudovirales phage TaxID=2100421 RepID=A0A6J5MPJ8_9CAUD|nr:hypothetical protein UFOVP432_9 [uncultured Caudovirales phage]
MAAGLGFKNFTTGEVLTAADTNGYLMQGVWVFASAAARDAAVTSPQEGNFAYLKDTNVTTYYTGSAWANLDTTGMTNPMNTTGDTIYSSSGSTPARLGIGSSGQVLTVAAGVPSWATPSSGGMTLLSTTALSGSTTTVSSISGSYTNLLIILAGTTLSTTAQLRFQCNSANTYLGVVTNGTATVSGGVNRFTYASASSYPIWQFQVYDYSSARRHAISFSGSDGSAATVVSSNFGGGNTDTTSAVTSITFSPDAGTFTGGSILIYGVK